MIRTLGFFAGAVLAAALVTGCGSTTPITSATATPATPFPPQVTNDFTIPTTGSMPAGVSKGSNGGVWFTEETQNKIGYVSSTGTVYEFPFAPPNGATNADPLSIVLGQDGNMWFTLSNTNAIAKSTSVGAVTFYTIPNTASRPNGIAAGPDGALWVTDPGTNSIWSITTAGVATQYPLVSANADPTSIIAGPNGALWFVEHNTSMVGTIAPGTAAGASPTEFPVSAGAGLGAIVTGPDNALWFTETSSDKLGRMLTTGTLTAETPLTGMSKPFGLVLAGDGNLYVGDTGIDQLAQYKVSTGAVTLYPTKTKPAGVYWLALGPDNEIYFSEQTANAIGQFRYF